jgi:hypothetical protein
VKGPGICDGNITGSLAIALAFVTSRRLVFFNVVTDFLGSKTVGERVVTFGEDSSIAAAYALDRVLKAVAEVGSAFVLRDVEDLPIVAGVGEDWI